MIEGIIDFSVQRRWLILLIALAAAASGFWSLTKLPIDAVPDITNVQVQVNAVAPALTPVEIATLARSAKCDISKTPPNTATAMAIGERLKALTIPVLR